MRLGEITSCADCKKEVGVFDPKTDHMWVIRDDSHDPVKRRVCRDCFYASMPPAEMEYVVGKQ